MKVSKVTKLFCIVLGLLMFTALSNAETPFEKGLIEPSENLPVYFMGDGASVEYVRMQAPNTEPVRNFYSIAAGHVLIVDNSYEIQKESMESEFIKNQLVAGTPVIALGNTSVVKNLFEGQFSPGISDGLTPGGLPVIETAFGFITFKRGNQVVTKVFITSEDDPKKAAKIAYEWAVKNVPQRGIEEEISRIFSPYWGYQYELDYSTGDSWNPYGRMNVATKYYKLYDDNSGTYDWYDIRFKHQSVPGDSLGWSGGWKTADLYAWLDADYYDTSYKLYDYGPTTTSGTSTVGVSVGVTAGESGAGVSASMSWSYSISDVVVNDQSDFYVDRAKWWHDVNQAANVGKYTYLSEPGACVRVMQGDPLEWREHYGAKYGHKVFLWWEYTTEGWVEFHL